MKILRKKDEPAGGAKPAAAPVPVAQPKIALKVLNRAPAPAAPKITREEENSRKIAKLLGTLASHLPDHDQHIDGQTDMAGVIQACGFASLQASGLLNLLRRESDSSDAATREAAMLALAQLCDAVGRPCETYVVPLLGLFLERLADKVAGVREAAMDACLALAKILCPHAVELVLPVLFDAMGDSKKYQTKEGALKLLTALSEYAPNQVSAALPDIVPLISSLMVDIRDQVKAAAREAGHATFSLMGNRDIGHLVDDFLGCAVKPEEVAAAVTKLSATTFVQSIEAPALAVMVPLLMRGLKEETSIKRKACVIITNMSKLVNSPKDASRFLPRLLPGVALVADAASDPEVREVASSAMVILERVSKEAELVEQETAKADPKEVIAALRATMATHPEAVHCDETTLEYVTQLCCLLMNMRCFTTEDWKDCCVPYLTNFLSQTAAEEVCLAFMSKCSDMISDSKEEDNGWTDSDGEKEVDELCNCKFSLAYGGKILLNNATLRLVRGRRYGLCGANGAGKSTLMKAIDRGQLENFPPADKVKIVYVEHDIQGQSDDCSVVSYVAHDPKIACQGKTLEQCSATLSSVGFSEAMQQGPITAISGGWKMKLALARAMLIGADILLLDEPTNHLDVTNVAWLENYLVSQPQITSMIVSHDSGFLDNVCTDIIHYHSRKLRRYRGNLSEFVRLVPTAKSYYQLEAAMLRFKFPTPGLLDGITSKDKPIVKLTNVTFSYPGKETPQLDGVSVICRLSSRVACLGANGAGKSTLIKIITGEHKATTGTLWKHPNLRMAYVAQHAFHHLEEHLDTTPLKYMFRRFGKGEDVEEQGKVDRVITEEEKQIMRDATWIFTGAHEGFPRKFEAIVGRRKKKKDFEYEVSWQGLPSIKWNKWISRDELIQKGFLKKVLEFDSKKAASALGNDSRPLTRENVEKFLTDFGLEPEFGVHSNIRGLSGGQKVKLVLAAAMWNNPHLLIMDEPTNYLDREALGALAAAIKDFDGGVLLISHNSEFVGTCCNETWRVEGGKVTIVGKNADASE